MEEPDEVSSLLNCACLCHDLERRDLKEGTGCFSVPDHVKRQTTLTSHTTRATDKAVALGSISYFVAALLCLIFAQRALWAAAIRFLAATDNLRRGQRAP